MGQDHLDNIVINISLDPAAATGLDFFFPMYMADEANGTTLDGDRTRSYTDTAAIGVDETAGFLSALSGVQLRAGLAQNPRPTKVKIGRQDSGGGETIVQAYDLIRADDDAFYSIDIESRVDADLVFIGEHVESIPRKVAIIQSGAADFKTSGFPAGVSVLEGNERTMICYHQTDGEPLAFAYASNRLAFNPSNFSVPWDAAVSQIAATEALSQGEKDFLDANHANHGLPLDGALFYMDPGHNANGRPFYEIVTRDLYEAVLQSRVATTKVTLSGSGRKWPVTFKGQAKLLNLANQLYDELASLGDASHFIPGERSFRVVPITSDDLDNQRMKLTGQGRFAVSGRKFQMDFNFTRQPIVPVV